MNEKIKQQIEKEAEHAASFQFNKKYSRDQHTSCVICYRNGATAWAERGEIALDQAARREEKLAAALEEIAGSNCDYESANYAKALHHPECRACKAKQALAEWKEGENVVVNKAKAEKCGSCGIEGIHQYLGNQFYLCDKCFEAYKDSIDQPKL